MMFDPNSDPLGVALAGRARERRLAMSLHGLSSPIGPLTDPRWDSFQQAVSEASGPHMRYGYTDQPNADLSRDPAALASQYRALPQPATSATFQHSQQLGTPLDSLRSLYRSRSGGA